MGFATNFLKQDDLSMIRPDHQLNDDPNFMEVHKITLCINAKSTINKKSQTENNQTKQNILRQKADKLSDFNFKILNK